MNGSSAVGTVGLSQHACDMLGEVVYVELPAVGAKLKQFGGYFPTFRSHHSDAGEAGAVESVKAASDVYSPLSGTVVEVNEALNDAPKLINQSPMDKGWWPY